MVVSVWALLNTRREVWRSSMVADPMGGRSRSWAKVGDVRCKVDIPSAREREMGGQWSAEHTHSVFLAPSADVRRGDEIRGGAYPLRVLAVVEPSSGRYRKALCRELQPEG